MSLYVNQNYGQPTSHLRRYSLRLDGFASLRGEFAGGEVKTRLIKFKGGEPVDVRVGAQGGKSDLQKWIEGA